MVSAKGLRMSFAGVEVLKGVDVDLFPGEVHAIVGENGAGKSTVAKLIGGVYQPVAGQISISGAPTQIGSPRQAIQLGVALIHQEPLTFPDLEVSENVFAGYQPSRGVRGVDWKAMRQEAGQILGRLGSRVKPTDRVANLSIADQQMVELAAALSHNAKVFLLDETTASLTPKEVEELFVIVRKLREDGCALAFVSHRLEEVFSIADRVTVLRDGEQVATLIPNETSPEEIVRLMVGRDHSDLGLAPRSYQAQEPVLEVKGLSRGSKFHDVSFQLRRGEILGLGGMVGAGRTEVCEAIFGIALPTGGQVLFDAKPVTIRKPADAIRLGIGLVPEDRQHNGLFMPMQIKENTSSVGLAGFARAGWVDRGREGKTATEYATRLRTKLRSVLQPVKELSGGNQQKVVLSKWLLTKPKVLILDEPTRGVDIGAKAEIHMLIRELVEQGMSILIVSSDLPELLGLSDRILVMRQGRIAAEFKGVEADAESVMRAATGQAA